MPVVRTLPRKRAGVPARKTAKKVTLDDVWAGFAELQKAHKEAQKAQRKAHAETEAAIKETQKGLQDLKETVKETSRVAGDLCNKFGDEAEHTLVPGLIEKFEQFGFVFGAISPNRKIKDKTHGIYAEVDAFLENGTQAMAVEVKAKLQMADVDTHLKRMEKLRAYADLHGDRRDLFGALAATVVRDKEREYALENGFFVIEPSGEDVAVTRPETSPRVWRAAK